MARLVMRDGTTMDVLGGVEEVREALAAGSGQVGFPGAATDRITVDPAQVVEVVTDNPSEQSLPH